MAIKNNTDLALAIIAIALFSFFGWLIFRGINELFPQLATFHPIMKLIVGFAGIFVLVRLGMKKIG